MTDHDDMTRWEKRQLERAIRLSLGIDSPVNPRNTFCCGKCWKKYLKWDRYQQHLAQHDRDQGDEQVPEEEVLNNWDELDEIDKEDENESQELVLKDDEYNVYILSDSWVVESPESHQSEKPSPRLKADRPEKISPEYRFNEDALNDITDRFFAQCATFGEEERCKVENCMFSSEFPQLSMKLTPAPEKDSLPMPFQLTKKNCRVRNRKRRYTCPICDGAIRGQYLFRHHIAHSHFRGRVPRREEEIFFDLERRRILFVNE